MLIGATTSTVSNILDCTGGLKLSGTSVTASAAQLNYTAVTTAGTAEASKALVLDSGKSATSITALSVTRLLADQVLQKVVHVAAATTTYTWVGERVLVVATGSPGNGCTVTMPDAAGASVAGSVVSLYVNGGDNLVIARSSTNTFNNGTTSITLSNDYEGCTLVAVNTASHVGWLLVGFHSPIRTTPF